MAGQEIYTSHAAMRQAKQRIKACAIAFTTCIGAGIGLLRSQSFDIVVIDEASQQTEPASLVPLVKGCSKAILVGDHVQLRPTVQQIALAMDFDVSLFERLYRSSETEAREEPQPAAPNGGAGPDSVSRLMLDTQYRMHETICEFSSREFYGGALRTGIARDSRPLADSAFPWPVAAAGAPGALAADKNRMVFVECGAREDYGAKSKSNRGQAMLCAEICRLLGTAAGGEEQGPRPAPAQSVAVLTPYAKQAELLKKILAGRSRDVEVSTIDAFQGRETDVVVLVTVRCNEHGEIGFLKDLRRMNVALTRARAGLVVVGNRATLLAADKETGAMWQRLLDSLVSAVVEPPKPA